MRVAALLSGAHPRFGADRYVTYTKLRNPLLVAEAHARMLRCHAAARIIQRAYRSYRLRVLVHEEVGNGGDADVPLLRP